MSRHISAQLNTPGSILLRRRSLGSSFLKNGVWILWRWSCLVGCLTCAGYFSCGDAFGDTLVWIGGGGFWTNDFNWQPQALPDATRDVEIDTGVPNLTATGFSRDITVAKNGNAAFLIGDSGDLSSRTGYVGRALNSIGSVSVDGHWTLSAALVVGDQGKGTVTIHRAVVESATGDVGVGTNADGVVTLDAEGSPLNSEWRITNNLRVGISGAGTVQVLDGGWLRSNGGTIGGSLTSDAHVHINQATWSNSGVLNVSSGGELTIKNKGGVASSSGTINGADIDTRATVSIDDDGLWTTSGSLIIGNAGYGKLTIAADSDMENNTGTIGLLTGSDGEVFVTGEGSKWTNDGRLTVGGDGKAKLKISNGGEVTSNTAIIADAANSIATVIVEGNASWDNTGLLEIGDTNGNGTQGTLIVQQFSNLHSTGGYEVKGKGTLSGNGFVVGGNVTSSATVAPGYVNELNGANVHGTLTITGNYTQVAGHLQIELGTDGYDKLDIDGSITLLCGFFGACNLDVAFSDVFYPAIGQSFDILDWGSVGSFAPGPNNGFTLNLPSLNGGRVWDVSQLYTTGVIKVGGASTVTGDFNGNGFADAGDFVVLRKNPNSTSTMYNQWRGNFGNSGGAGAGQSFDLLANVPEPSSGALVLFSIVWSLTWRAGRRG